MYVLRGGGRGGDGEAGDVGEGEREEGGEGKRAPNYQGIGPLDSETGIPVGLRSVRTEARREGRGRGGRGPGRGAGGGRGGEEGAKLPRHRADGQRDRHPSGTEECTY